MNNIALSYATQNLYHREKCIEELKYLCGDVRNATSASGELLDIANLSKKIVMSKELISRVKQIKTYFVSIVRMNFFEFIAKVRDMIKGPEMER